MTEWERSLWQPGGGDAFLFYAVFGTMPSAFEIDARRYRTSGLPEGVEVRHFSRQQKPAYVSHFTEGEAWDQVVTEQPALAQQILASPDLIVVAGAVKDPDSLSYLRNTIGVVTYILDHQGVAALDLQTMSWYSRDRWREWIFDSSTFVPYRHAVILVSQEDHDPALAWFHTRGMRKFGRPDISVHDVPSAENDVVAELCNRFSALQALGELVPEGQAVYMDELPWSGTIRHGGDMDDIDFNNVHIEVLRDSTG